MRPETGGPEIAHDHDQDTGAIQALYREVDRIRREALPTVFRSVSGDAGLDSLIADQICEPDRDSILGEYDERVVGFAAVRAAAYAPYPMFHALRFCLLEDVVVGHD